MIDSPYDFSSPGGWLRGNLHTHTNRSDGKQPMQEVVDRYHSLGYDFLMISDHDVLTAESDYAALDSHGMTLIPGNEVSAHGMHILHVHADNKVEPDPDRQQVIDQINASQGFAVMCHPLWNFRGREHAPLESLQALNGYIGVEVYNAGIELLDGNPEAGYRWDSLLHDGRRVWGFANDDCHDVTFEQGGMRRAGAGWNMVWSDDASAQGIVSAMQAGAFYASTGVMIDRIDVEGVTIRLQTKNASRIVALQQVGRQCAAADASELTIEFPDDATYLRFECYGPRGSKAWTQPIFRKETT